MIDNTTNIYSVSHVIKNLCNSVFKYKMHYLATSSRDYHHLSIDVLLLPVLRFERRKFLIIAMMMKIMVDDWMQDAHVSEN